MADVKISELTALTTPDGAEELVVNDGGTTKKITLNNAITKVNYGGVTKLAATSTGVNATGNVGIGTSSPEASLEIVNTASTLTAPHIALEGSGGAEDDFAIYCPNGLNTLNFGYSNSVSPKDNILVLDSSGNVGIGSSSPSVKLESTTAGTGLPATSGTSQPNGALRLSSSATSGIIDFGLNSANPWIQATDSGGLNNNYNLLLNPNGGNVFVGKLSPSITTAGVEVLGSGIVRSTADGAYAMLLNRITSDGVLASFYRGTSSVGNISVTATATTYSTSSDYRLKEADVPMTGATERVKALRPVNFAWKVDGSRVDGFFAHELAEVVPEAGTGTKDAMMDEDYEVTPATGEVFYAGSEAGFTEVSPAIAASPAYYDVNGNVIKAEVIAQAAVHEAYDAVLEVIHSAAVTKPETLLEGQEWRETTAAVIGTRSVPDMQGIDQSKVIPLLTAAIKELITRMEALEEAVQ